jgi:hypothetical protein
MLLFCASISQMALLNLSLLLYFSFYTLAFVNLDIIFF